MNGCDRLKSVSLHISKLKQLNSVDFSECRALSEASWNDSSSDVAMETDNIHSNLPVLDVASSSFPDNLINCFNYDQEARIDRRQTCFLQFMSFSGEEVLSYFTHRTTGTSLTNIPLFYTSPSPPFFRFKACAVVDCISANYGFSFNIHVSCRFKGKLGNNFDSPYRPRDFYKREKGIHLVIFECSFPLSEENTSLAEVNYDHVDVQFHLSNWNEPSDSKSKLKRWGIRLSDDFSSLVNYQLGNGNILPDVSEADEDYMTNESEHSEESGGSNEEIKRSKKRIRVNIKNALNIILYISQLVFKGNLKLFLYNSPLNLFFPFMQII
ncbi:Protein VARIATION IN COMPOUND TRIGGERED ROOT growth response [Cardamine amara subsp. amara]|uniref:Protein VARIATION IN COMPOUND TRIGGERED ROOT growth response n=1 Tax=Cardamine amara subsp. amara TaxID=228776 RepID=A0ABD1ALG5_CARAN